MPLRPVLSLLVSEESGTKRRKQKIEGEMEMPSRKKVFHTIRFMQTGPHLCDRCDQKMNADALYRIFQSGWNLDIFQLCRDCGLWSITRATEEENLAILRKRSGWNFENSLFICDVPSVRGVGNPNRPKPTRVGKMQTARGRSFIG